MRIRNPKGTHKTTCSKCGNPIEKSRITQRYCKKCHAAQMRRSRPKHSQLTPEQRLKSNCRSYTKVYLKRGKIVKLPCRVCGDIKSQAHHHDYNKPLDIEWYCRKHHLELHSRVA